MYNSFILPIPEYCNVVSGGSHGIDMFKLDRIHIDGMRLVTGAMARSNILSLNQETG